MLTSMPESGNYDVSNLSKNLQVLSYFDEFCQVIVCYLICRMYIPQNVSQMHKIQYIVNYNNQESKITQFPPCWVFFWHCNVAYCFF